MNDGSTERSSYEDNFGMVVIAELKEMSLKE